MLSGTFFVCTSHQSAPRESEFISSAACDARDRLVTYPAGSTAASDRSGPELFSSSRSSASRCRSRAVSVAPDWTPAAAHASMATWAVMSQLPSGVGATWRPRR